MIFSTIEGFTHQLDEWKEKGVALDAVYILKNDFIRAVDEDLLTPMMRFCGGIVRTSIHPSRRGEFTKYSRY